MSYNSLFGLGSHSEDANLEGWWLLQDDAASTVVDDQSSNGRDGTLQGGSNTSDISGTGPNNWLTKALAFDGANDRVTLPDTVDITAADQTLVAWMIADSATPGNTKWFGQGDGNTNGGAFDWTSEGGCRLRHGGGNITYGSLTPTNWNCIVAVIPSGGTDTDDITARGNGSALTPSRTGGSNQTLSIAANGPVIGQDAISSLTRYDGLIAHVARFSRALTTAEQDEIYDGPEPINSVAPTVSGTETEGQTLSVTTGTWGLDAPFSSGSNGTITYSYQWTRSDDGTGTNEADISGATSSTYTLVSADVGKFIRCRVRASNDGGFDSSADTNSDFTGEIQASGAVASIIAQVMHHRRMMGVS